MNEIETITMPNRPHEISTFTVEEMPRLIEKIESGNINVDNLSNSVNRILDQGELSEFIDRHSQLLPLGKSFAGNSRNYPSDPILDILHLDLSMIESAINAFDGQIPQILSDSLNIIADTLGLPPCITYEMIIYQNPQTDPRTFTSGEVRKTELFFYNIHEKIENLIDQVIYKFLGVAQQIPSRTTSINLLNESIGLMEKSSNLMKSIIQMDREHFLQFRKFFSGNTHRDTKGPSGAFSDSIPLLEICLTFPNVDDQLINYLNENQKYFPRRMNAKLRSLLMDLDKVDLLKLHSDYPEEIQKLKNELLTIRQFHLGAVNRHIPELRGTAGEEPKKFLGQRINYIEK